MENSHLVDSFSKSGKATTTPQNVSPVTPLSKEVMNKGGNPFLCNTIPWLAKFKCFCVDLASKNSLFS